MEDNTMEQLPSPDTNQSRTIPPGAQREIVRSMLKWGSGLGLLAGLITGTILALRLGFSLSMTSPWSTLFALGFAGVTFACLILGLAIGLIDAWALVRFLPALVSGKTRRSVAVFLAATLAVILVFPLALFLLSIVWHDVLSNSFILVPTIFLALIAWSACNVIGERVLKSTFNSPSVVPPPSPQPR